MSWLHPSPSPTSAPPSAVHVSANLSGDDVILCQITSQATRDPFAIPLLDADFAEGGLRYPSFIRPNRLFTADGALILYRAGHISATKRAEVVAVLIALFHA